MQSIEQLTVTVTPDGRVSRKDAAKLFDRRPKTLSDWKGRGWGPKAFTVAGRDFYDFQECMEMARGEKPLVPGLA